MIKKMNDKRFPGPLTDKQIEAHLNKHQKLPPHSHTPEGMEQIRKYQIWQVEEGNRRAKAEREARLKREADEKQRRQKIVQACKPKIDLERKAITRRGGAVIVKCLVSNGSAGIRRHYVQSRALGSSGWTRHAPAIPSSQSEPVKRTIMGLVASRTYELAVLTEHAYGDILSDTITVSFSEADKPKPPPKPPEPEPDPDPPTDEQIQAYLDGKGKLADHTHPIVRNAVNRYQRRQQEERNKREEVHAARRRAENERKYREFKKHPERLARLRRTPPRIKVLKRRIWVSGIQIEVDMDRGSTAESLYLRVDTGDKIVQIGPRISPANLPYKRWLTLGGGGKVFAAAHNKYGSVESERIEIGADPSSRIKQIMESCKTYTGRRLRGSGAPYLKDLRIHADISNITSDERHESHWRINH